MDPSRKPWEDFYQYANGKWIAETEIPSDRPSVYVFTLLAKRNREQLRARFWKRRPTTRTRRRTASRGKVGLFYRSGMDEKKIEEQGVKPLRAEFDRLAALKNAGDILPVLARLHTYRSFAAFDFASTPDLKDSRACHRRVLAGRAESARPRLLPQGRRSAEEDPRRVS